MFKNGCFLSYVIFEQPHIKINPFRKKFDLVPNSVAEYIDILIISETKLDSIFPHGLYHIKDFSNPYRLDTNSYGGKILVYMRDDIPSNLLKLDLKFGNFKGLFIELQLSKKSKWLLRYSYNQHNDNTNKWLLSYSYNQHNGNTSKWLLSYSYNQHNGKTSNTYLISVMA